MKLDDVIRESLDMFYADIVRESWHRRERELVSLYAIGHLLNFCGKAPVLTDRTQVGIEVAVPQHVSSRRHKSDVCKDVVIWPQPRMSLWGKAGRERNYPLAVMEWKSLNPMDAPSDCLRKHREYNQDIAWLQEASRLSQGFTGYAVLVIQNSGIPSTRMRSYLRRLCHGEVVCQARRAGGMRFTFIRLGDKAG